MSANFERSMDFVLKWEGGYVNDPDDPGGETKYGISKRAFPKLNIKDLTLASAKTIYLNNYWVPAGCKDMPWPDCLIQFDTAVNMGVSRALEFGKKSSGWQDYIMRRVAYYNALATRKPDMLKYLRGWLNRVIDLYETCRGQKTEHPLSAGYGP